MKAKIAALVAAVTAAASAAGAATYAKRRKGGGKPARRRSSGQAAAKGAPTAATQSRPAASGSGPVSTTMAGGDDLTAIKGLGKVKAGRLAEAGISTYAQIAAWTDDDIAEVGLKVNTSPGQIKREDWVGQARELARRQ